jgi:hypothetical protein
MNALFPVALLAFAYFAFPDRAADTTSPLESSGILFWVLGIIAIVEGGIAILLRQKLFFSPMIYSKETFVEDLTTQTFTFSIICYAITAGISIYGFVLFMLDGTLNQLILFIVISYLAFLVTRPRHGFMKRVIDRQWALVEQGKFRQRVK